MIQRYDSISGEDLYVSALERIAKLEAERDRQYEFNAGQIAKIAKLEAEREQMLEALQRYEEQVQGLKRIIEEEG